MKAVTEYAKREISLGNWLTLLAIVFAAGGAYWQLTATEDRLTDHIQNDFSPVEERVDRMRKNMVPYDDLDDFVTEQQYNSLQEQNKQDLQALKELMREIQSNTNSRLDYIIERLDEQRN